MGNFINKLLAPILQAFKTKSPKVFLAFATVATVLQFGLSSVVQLVIPGVTLEPNFLSLAWIIDTLGLNIDESLVSGILWFLALITGSSSSAWLDPQKRTVLVEESKLNAKEMDLIRSAEPEPIKQEKLKAVREERKARRLAKKASQ